MLRWTVFILSLSSLAIEADASCTLQQKKDNEPCQYNNSTFKVNITKTFPEECVECKCQKAVMSCCGYGYKAGVIAVEKGYKKVIEDCEVTIVKVGEN